MSVPSSFVCAKNAPDSFADLAEKLMPSVVNIASTQTIKTTSNPFPFQFPPGSPFEDMFKEFNQPRERKSTGLGSGFIIDSKGIVVTNNHVIQGAEDIIVSVNGSKEYKAKVIGKDPYMDLAVLQIESDEKFKPVSFGDSDKARIGDWVVAIGNPFGFGGTVTSGIISSRNRDIGLTRYDDFIQTDASINQGNSGGPLFNLDGKVIGINTAIIAPGRSGSIGIGFAIPSNPASHVIEQLIEFGETKRGWLGVRIQVVTKEIADVEKLEEVAGALVASVSEGSPAGKAGVKAGDIILEFDGKKVDTMRRLPKLVAQTQVGKRVKVKIWRNQKLISKTVLLGRLESSKEFKAENKIESGDEIIIETLKISVRDLNKNDISERDLPKNSTGIVVTKISENSPLMFLSVNDVIVELQKKKITSSNQFSKLVNDIVNKGQKTLMFAIYDSGGQRTYLTVKLK
ncbi:MAG: Do family serine endopeptidase [Pelagibacteraceae bacterium]|nr:Do family serine endopeptidase [Pelagibacteraceae bacterium]MDP6710456.1 Do family serine endopeptidase [Pelagibacteraceae bacterium]|tara:strand:- start:5997 stop:7367 length:1371 start_codon:yes stop_codon:yes gene_type:complete